MHMQKHGEGKQIEAKHCKLVFDKWIFQFYRHNIYKNCTILKVSIFRVKNT